jgi:hypothetical protein
VAASIAIVDVDASAVARFGCQWCKEVARERLLPWELLVSLSRSFSKLVSAAMSLPLIALNWAHFPSSRAWQ